MKKENVKTLSPGVFARIDRLAAPRLVEYWEVDPCVAPDPRSKLVVVTENEIRIMPTDKATAAQYGVKVEAKFSAGEYDVVILSAKNSVGLEAYLHAEKYQVPAGAAPYLRPYVAHGSKFFVAKVNVSKVKFEKGQAKLSPLRFHYDSESFSLPVRLGLINSAGKQDLLVHILAKSRYEVANYENVTIPTNLRVKENVKDSFGAFYAALFDDVIAKHPKAVVTEYAWSAGSCDPCPTPPLSLDDMSAFGLDVLPEFEAKPKALPWIANMYTLTRLHARYDSKSLGEDLVFREAKGIVGGNGVPGPEGAMDTEVHQWQHSTFQGRYVMLHPWQGPMQCAEPHHGFWGGPPKGVATQPGVATDTAFALRGAELASFLDAEPVKFAVAPKLIAENTPPPVTSAAIETPPPKKEEIVAPPPPAPVSSGCASCTMASSRHGSMAFVGVSLVGLAGLLRRRLARK